MTAFTNHLTAAELERLALLSEEMGEVQQIIGKIIRHGYQSYNPFDTDHITNRLLLEKELGDLSAAINIMAMAGDIDRDSVQKFSIDKMRKINRWLHHFQVNIPSEH